MSEKKKRKAPNQANVESAEVLNHLSLEVVQKLYGDLRGKAVLDPSGCLFPRVSVKNGEYPRRTINKDILGQINDKTLRAKAMASPKVRIPYSMIAYRAAGNVIPAFELGQDLSHTCRRGQMRDAPSKGSALCSDVRNGCFNAACITIETHTENLSRGRCIPLVRCPNCTLVFDQCEHTPTCGTDYALEESLSKQSPIKRIRVEYVNGEWFEHFFTGDD